MNYIKLYKFSNFKKSFQLFIHGISSTLSLDIMIIEVDLLIGGTHIFH